MDKFFEMFNKYFIEIITRTEWIEGTLPLEFCIGLLDFINCLHSDTTITCNYHHALVRVAQDCIVLVGEIIFYSVHLVLYISVHRITIYVQLSLGSKG
jgi:hypothetical protein